MPAAALAISDLPDGRRVVSLDGRLDASTVRDLWEPAHRAVTEAPSRPVVVDAGKVEYCDNAGVALLVDLVAQKREAPVEVANLKPSIQALYHQFDPQRVTQDLDPEPKRRPAIEELGRAAYAAWKDIADLITFVGELTGALVDAALHPQSVRWKDVWRVCERVGADALPIVALISFLLGMILAFQSAVPMKRFGAEIFVADLIGLSMLRELGPLMTAILLAGRSGAAFAAEIGTMRVNQEVDAITTMGLDPVRFLVTPRIIAAVLMTPLLTVFSDLVGLIGGALTMQSFAIPFATFLKEVDSAVTLTDFLAGFVKSFVFAVMFANMSRISSSTSNSCLLMSSICGPTIPCSSACLSRLFVASSVKSPNFCCSSHSLCNDGCMVVIAVFTLTPRWTSVLN